MYKSYPKNFSRKELLWSATGTRLGIDNVPESEQIEHNILATAHFLQDLRDALNSHFGKEMPIRVYSCYRCPRLNRAVGGSKTSAHMKGLAADIVVQDMTPLALAEFIRDHFEFDQVILEFNQWVHVGIPTPHSSRRQLLTAVKDRVNGVLKTKYLTGIIAMDT